MSKGIPTKIGRIEALTSLRFLAAFVVLCIHFGKETALVHFVPGLFMAGSEMVTLFFVLSGFVLTLAYIGKPNTSTGEYYVNRIARIAPAYYLALIVVVLGSASHGFSNLDWKAVLLSATFLHSWVPPYGTSLNYPAWTLSVEMSFYLIFPLLLKGALSMRMRNLLLLSLFLWAVTQAAEIYLVNSAWYRGNQPNAYFFLFFFPLPFLCSFFMGIYGGRLLASRNETEQPNEFSSSLRTGAICLLTLFVVVNQVSISQLAAPLFIPTMGSLFTPLFLLLILQLSLGHDRLSRVLSLPVLVALGQASYSFYILQVPVHRIYLKVISPHIPNNVEAQYWTFVVVLIVVAILSQKFIEVPAAKFVRRLAPKKASPMLPAAMVPVVTNTP